MDKFKKFMERVFDSKKLFYAAVPIFSNMVAEFWGFNPMSKTMLVLDSLFAGLLIIQGFLDVKFGSHSDGTEKVALKMAVVEKAPAVTVVNKVEDK